VALHMRNSVVFHPWLHIRHESCTDLRAVEPRGNSSRMFTVSVAAPDLQGGGLQRSVVRKSQAVIGQELLLLAELSVQARELSTRLATATPRSRSRFH